MKILKHPLIIAFVFIVLCNIFSGYFKFFIEGNLYDFKYYVTQDKKFVTEALNLESINNSTNYRYYLAYRKAYPKADTTLYRINPLLLYRFWRWAEYLISPHWKQPYMEMSYKEWDKIMMQMWNNDNKYGNPFPKDIVSLQK